MKQIIVNVSGLSVEEKQRVNEALAKIIDSPKAPERSATLWSTIGSMYAPSSLGHHVGLDFYNSESQTHTPQQVLEMAGMTTKRKIREDFDPKQPISVDVSGCTEDEKKEVQQAFFDVGIKWESGVAGFRYLNAELYSNSTTYGSCYGRLMYGTLPRKDSISRQQFLSMVYEPVQQGHVHAVLMAQYADDAKTSKTPWELWEYLDKDGGWTTHRGAPGWYAESEYRRKPKTHMVHGVEIPDLRVSPEYGTYYYLADPTERDFTCRYLFHGDTQDSLWFERGLAYQPTEEGKQAAILHSQAMLGII